MRYSSGSIQSLCVIALAGHYHDISKEPGPEFKTPKRNWLNRKVEEVFGPVESILSDFRDKAGPEDKKRLESRYKALCVEVTAAFEDMADGKPYGPGFFGVTLLWAHMFDLDLWRKPCQYPIDRKALDRIMECEADAVPDSPSRMHYEIAERALCRWYK